MNESLEQSSPLKQFHLEIAELKRKEQEESVSVHLRDLTPEKLTEQDMKIYNKLKNGTLKLVEFREYRHISCNVSKNFDSCEFAAFIGNHVDYWKNRMS